MNFKKRNFIIGSLINIRIVDLVVPHKPVVHKKKYILICYIPDEDF